MSAKAELLTKGLPQVSISEDGELRRSLNDLASILINSMLADVGLLILKNNFTGEKTIASKGFLESENKCLAAISDSRIEDVNRVFSDRWHGSTVCYSRRHKTGQSMILAGRRSEESFNSKEKDFLNELAEYFSITTERLMEIRQAEVLTLARERERFASELHDGLAQSIYSLALQLKACRRLLRKDVKAADDKLKVLENLAGEQIEEIRSYMRNLKANRGIADDFNNRIKRLCKHVCAVNNLELTFTIQGQVIELTRDARENMYFVVSEALTNIIRHSDAAKVRVLFRYDEAELELSVEDDGRGFNTSMLSKRGKVSGMGLGNIENRVDSLGGSLIILSRCGAGTRIIATVPYEKRIESVS